MYVCMSAVLPMSCGINRIIRNWLIISETKGDSGLFPLGSFLYKFPRSLHTSCLNTLQPSVLYHR